MERDLREAVNCFCTKKSHPLVEPGELLEEEALSGI